MFSCVGIRQLHVKMHRNESFKNENDRENGRTAILCCTRQSTGIVTECENVI